MAKQSGHEQVVWSLNTEVGPIHCTQLFTIQFSTFESSKRTIPLQETKEMSSTVLLTHSISP